MYMCVNCGNFIMFRSDNAVCDLTLETDTDMWSVNPYIEFCEPGDIICSECLSVDDVIQVNLDNFESSIIDKVPYRKIKSFEKKVAKFAEKHGLPNPFDVYKKKKINLDKKIEEV